MPERTAMLTSAIFTTALVSALFAQSSPGLRAEEECISKPNAPAPQGQHWYYRTDHASNRQCWRLGPQGLPVQNSAPQTEEQPAPVAAQSTAPPRAQLRETTGASPAERARDTAPASTAQVPWPDAPKSQDLPPFLQPVPRPAPMVWTQSASASGSASTVSGHVSENVRDPSPPLNTVASASVSDTSPGDNRAREPQRPASARSAASAAPMQSIREVDHTFALLMVGFALLAVTGPVHHYTKRRRQRETSNFRVPQWARVVALNAPKPRARVSVAPESNTGRRLAPLAPRPPDQTEKLAQVLQQLVDRMQTDRRQAANTVPASGVRPRDRISPVRQQVGAR